MFAASLSTLTFVVALTQVEMEVRDLLKMYKFDGDKIPVIRGSADDRDLDRKSTRLNSSHT